jgi:predicted DNA-binding transcriptional regulator YafY
MPLAQRNLLLVDILRRQRRPIAGKILAAEMGVSIRTLYRDIQALVSQGVPIEGEPGLGYVLPPGYLLPPLMFSQDEIEALALGVRFVGEQPDPRLTDSAQLALAKILAVLPQDASDRLRDLGLFAGPVASVEAEDAVLPMIRAALRGEVYLSFTYTGSTGPQSARRVKPIALGYFQQARVLAAWCQARAAFRHFRVDRISNLGISSERYRPSRRQLLRTWKATEGIPDQS